MDYSISQVSKMYNLSIHTLRYYEKEGLLPSIKRTRSGIRKFDETTISGIKIVECLKKSGMPLKDIKLFIEWCEQGDASLIKRRDMFHERRETVIAQIAEMQKVLDVINYKCWYYDTAVDEGTESGVLRKMPAGMNDPLKDL
jgi:DNA-binding transcriptional MerR regulator